MTKTSPETNETAKRRGKKEERKSRGKKGIYAFRGGNAVAESKGKEGANSSIKSGGNKAREI